MMKNFSPSIPILMICCLGLSVAQSSNLWDVIEATAEVSSITDTNNVTTTPAPPVPPIPPQPMQGNWTVKDPATGVTCIMVSVTAAVIIPYRTQENTTKNATLNVPPNANARGSCGSRDQHIELSWNYAAAGAATSNNSLIFIFRRKQKTTTSVSDGKFFLTGAVLRVYLNPVNFPGALNTTRLDAAASDVSFYETPVEKSHICRPEERIPMKMSGQMNTTAYLILSNIQVEAFRTRTDEIFSEAENCEPQGLLTSDVIPIAVGASLGVVFVAALIAYLIGRRRMRQVDYVSV